MRTIRRLSVVLLLALPALIAAPAAQAAGPTYQKVFISDTFVDESCGFPVQFQIVGYQGVLEWTTRDGSARRFEFFAAASLTLTNLQTGEVIRLAAGGPGHITQDTDGSFDFSGTGIWVFPRRPGTNEPGIWETVGNLTFTVDPDGDESVHLAGRLVDLCAELAD